MTLRDWKMKTLLSVREENNGASSGAFILTWAESAVQTRVVTNQDGTTARINKPVIQESEEVLQYSNPQQRSDIAAFIAGLK